jgi:Na+/H+-dicarboxylate symporter
MEDIFLWLVKMIIVPLVFSTLIVGGQVGDIASVGRLGQDAPVVHQRIADEPVAGDGTGQCLRTRHMMQLPLPDEANTPHRQRGLTLKTFRTTHFTSVIDAMAKNEILQIVVFSLFFGVATAAIGEPGKIVIQVMDAIAHVILKVTTYVMYLAPIAVFGAMTAIIAKQGLGILGVYSILIGQFYFGLLILWLLLGFAGYLVIGNRIVTLIKRLREPILLAFSTSSSEAAFPRTMEELKRFGCKDRVVSFVLPLGYSFNLDGSMMYMTFATLFIAQSYGIERSVTTQISMLLVRMVTSKGIAGVPRASLVLLRHTRHLRHTGSGLALLLGIDPLLDMGRSATNVVGNSVATAVVSEWEEKPTPHS